MRILTKLLLALSLATLLASPVLAANGNGNGNGNGSDKSESSGNNGNGNGNGGGNSGNGGGNSGNKGNGGSNGNGGSSGNGGNNGNGSSNGDANGNGNGNAKGKTEAPVTTNVIVAVPDEQRVVQNAVRTKRALPLDAITAVVAAETDGRILDVKLVTFNGIYLYDVTVLERNGVLHRLYYNARSGARVRAR